MFLLFLTYILYQKLYYMSILFINENVFIKIPLNKGSSTTIWVVQKVDDLVAPKKLSVGSSAAQKKTPPNIRERLIYILQDFTFSISCGSSQ